VVLLLPVLAACAALAGKPDPGAPPDAFEENQVDQVAVRIPSLSQGGPVYPAKLVVDRVQGQTIVQFVIDTLGRPDMHTFKVIMSDHALFTESVRATVSRTRFTPAEKSGRKVKMIARQPFNFTLMP
jgi:TonB family protein